MCLSIPGRIVEISTSPTGFTMGMVDMKGTTRRVNLMAVPEVRMGDYVMVHADLATSILEEHEAEEITRFLMELDGLVHEERPT